MKCLIILATIFTVLVSKAYADSYTVTAVVPRPSMTIQGFMPTPVGTDFLYR